MNVCLSDHPDRLELSIFRARGAYGSVAHGSAQEVYRYIKARTSRIGAAAELREMLARQGARNLRSDEDVLREAASQVMLGRLFLLLGEQRPAVSPGTGDPDAPPAPPERPKRPGVSPPPPLPPPRKAAATEAPPPEPEMTAALAQDVQAAALEEAARDGTPFCEVCEKAKAAKAAKAEEHAAAADTRAAA
ncbi:hypothetical protein ASC94_01825 [Massilia sp. Root418]|uniref:hypothetical protein n=1 Tax=Massilia sp. Root418 TaxID=1736532 RepID=UPI0006FDF681|nr:hypothetical protein [Massilia sp. Root418]KQX01394.1 hypothetical protein ASC94_01825 [Massilia sp. Root418]